MDVSGRRSSYTLLSQYPDEPPPSQFETLPLEKNRMKHPFDWPIATDASADQRSGVRISGVLPPVGLQRQSSEGSFGESSLSGEYYIPTTLSSVTATMGPEMLNPVTTGGIEGRGKEGADAVGSSSSSKSWAQQAEETYQLQLALALRLCSEASCANDPNYFDPGDPMIPGEQASAQTTSHRFWVNGSLSYNDKVPDGFYMIQGMDPFVWTLCTDVQEESRIPSIESLKAVHSSESAVEVILVDRHSDTDLKRLHGLVAVLSSNYVTTKEVVEQIAMLVCLQMGGAASDGEHFLHPRWKKCSETLKENSRSVVISIGKLAVGLCRHRALLFKILADSVHLPCRIAKGCIFCKSEESSSCLVRFGLEREYLVDLVRTPGTLCEPNSQINGPGSITILSPLRPSKCKPIKIADNFRSLAKQYFIDCQSLNLLFTDTSTVLDALILSRANQSNPVAIIIAKRVKDQAYKRWLIYYMLFFCTGANIAPEDDKDSYLSKNYCEKYADAASYLPAATNVPHVEISKYNEERISHAEGAYQFQMLKCHMQNAKPFGQPEANQLKFIPRDGEKEALPALTFHDSTANTSKPNMDVLLVNDDLIISWNDLVLKGKIGAGSFGTVHRAEWLGSEVAVKVLMDQDIHPERFREFMREVSIMKSLRHPNIVLFMGAVIQPPHLSIVTEYLSRGSLYRFLHKPGVKELLDERRRLSMAFDVAKGMNYLHKRNPPIVHRDLKSQNLLVDYKFTIKVCDFGLSRLKPSTYLSSKSLAGTPEWMAPEVLRDEPSNEKSDVYSFGVILWELMTLQQPWSNLNPAQVIAAVGFKGRRLVIPNDVSPEVASIIGSCWASEPWKRPSFSSIMSSLKQLLKSTSQAAQNELLLIA